MSEVIVVGAGVTGLLSSIMASEKGHKVTLIEAAPSAGGQLASWKNPEGISFDFGTHIAAETSSEDLNKILLEPMYAQPDNWTELHVLKVGNSIGGHFNDQSQFIDIQKLNCEHSDILNEIKAGKASDINNHSDLKAYLTEHFGKTATEQVFSDVIRKLQNADLEDLHPLVLPLFGLGRVIAADAKTSRELKKDPVLDQKVAFTSYNEGTNGRKKYYPRERSQGIGLWIDSLVNKAKEYDVDFKFKTSVTKLKPEVELSSGESLNPEHIIWTAPPIFAIKALNDGYKSAPTEFCPMSLHHFVFDKEFKADNHYVYNFDSKHLGFRYTLYSNFFEESKKPPFNCTVEILGHLSSDIENCAELLKDELIEVGILHPGTKSIYHKAIDVKFGFPKMTNQFFEEKNRQISHLENNMDNLILLGKSSRDKFFMNDLLNEAYDKLSTVLK